MPHCLLIYYKTSFTWSLHHPGGHLQTKLFDERVVVEVSFGYKVPERGNSYLEFAIGKKQVHNPIKLVI